MMVQPPPLSNLKVSFPPIVISNIGVPSVKPPLSSVTSETAGVNGTSTEAPSSPASKPPNGVLTLTPSSPTLTSVDSTPSTKASPAPTAVSTILKSLFNLPFQQVNFFVPLSGISSYEKFPPSPGSHLTLNSPPSGM